MFSSRRYRFTGLFYVGLLWLFVGLFNTKRTAFVTLGVTFMILGAKRIDEPPTDEEQPAPSPDMQ